MAQTSARWPTHRYRLSFRPRIYKGFLRMTKTLTSPERGNMMAIRYLKDDNGELRDDIEDDPVDEGDQPLIAAEELTQQIVEMQKESKRLFQQGLHHDSIDLVRKIVEIRAEVEGGGSVTLVDYITQICRVFNQASIELMGQDEPEESLQILQKTLEILEQVDQSSSKVIAMTSLTLNNTSCALKKKGEIQEAQECLETALRKQQKTRQPKQRTISSTDKEILSPDSEQNSTLFHLNLCALQSQKGNHLKAKTHASIAVKDLEIIVKDLKEEVKAIGGEDANDQDGASSQKAKGVEKLQERLKEKSALLAIAYYNLGCEYEHIHQIENCVEAYSRAQQLEKARNPSSNLAIQFSQCLRQARLKLRAINQQKLHQQTSKLAAENEQKRRERRTLATSESNPYIKNEKKMNSPKKPKRRLRPQSAKHEKNITIASNRRIDLEARATAKTDFNEYAVSQPASAMQMTKNRSSTPTLHGDRPEAAQPTAQSSLFGQKRSSSKGRNRPQSAAFKKEQNFTELERKSEKPLPISSNQKALRSFGNANWTKSWFSKAYVSTPLATAETQKNEMFSPASLHDGSLKQSHNRPPLNERPPQALMTSKVLNRIRGSRQSMQSDQKMLQKRSTSLSNLHDQDSPLKLNFNPQFMGSEHSATQTSNTVVAQNVGKNLEQAYRQELTKQEQIKHHLRIHESGKVQEIAGYTETSAAKRDRPTSAGPKKQPRFAPQKRLPEVAQKSRVTPVSVIVRVEKGSKIPNDNVPKQGKPGKRTKPQGQTSNLMNFNFKPPEIQGLPEMQERPATLSQLHLSEAGGGSGKSKKEINAAPTISGSKQKKFASPLRQARVEPSESNTSKRRSLKQKFTRTPAEKDPSKPQNIHQPQIVQAINVYGGKQLRTQQRTSFDSRGQQRQSSPNRHERVADQQILQKKTVPKKSGIGRRIKSIQSKIENERQMLDREKAERQILEEPNSQECSSGRYALNDEGTQPATLEHLELDKGCNAEQALKGQTGETEKAVVKIQSVFKGNQVRKGLRAEKQQKELEKATVKIQAAFKGQKVRSQLREQQPVKAQGPNFDLEDINSQPALIPTELTQPQPPVVEQIPSNTALSDEMLKNKEEDARIQSFIRSEIELSVSDERNQTKQLGQSASIIDEVGGSRIQTEGNLEASVGERAEPEIQTKRSEVLAVRLVDEKVQEEYRTGATERADIQQAVTSQPEKVGSLGTSESQRQREHEILQQKAGMKFLQRFRDRKFRRRLQFTQIESGEKVLTTKLRDRQYKIQAVRLVSDESLVRIGFKCINLNDPQPAQSELIHQTGIVNMEAEGGVNFVCALIQSLKIDPQTCTLSLDVSEPVTRPLQQESTLSARDVGQKMFVSSDSRNMTQHKLLFSFKAIQEGEQYPEKEVLVNFENDMPEDISQGQVILRTAIEAKNKVQIPIKQQRTDNISLQDLTRNLQRYLPKIVFLDQDGYVQLIKTERDREKLRRTKTGQPNADSVSGGTSRLLKSLGAEGFDSQSQAQSMRVEQRNRVQMPRINRVETMIAHKQPALGQDSEQSSLMHEERKQETPSISRADLEEKETQAAMPLKRALFEKDDRSSIKVGRESGKGGISLGSGRQAAQGVGPSSGGVSQKAGAEGSAQQTPRVAAGLTTVQLEQKPPSEIQDRVEQVEAEEQEDRHSEILQETARGRGVKESLNHEKGPPAELELKVKPAKVARAAKPQEIVHKTARVEAVENFVEDEAAVQSEIECRDIPVQARAKAPEKEDQVAPTSRAMAADKTLRHESRPPSEVGDKGDLDDAQLPEPKLEEVKALSTEQAEGRPEVVHPTARAEAVVNLVQLESTVPVEQQMQEEPTLAEAASNSASERGSHSTGGLATAEKMEHEARPPSVPPQSSRLVAERHGSVQEEEMQSTSRVAVGTGSLQHETIVPSPLPEKQIPLEVQMQPAEKPEAYLETVRNGDNLQRIGLESDQSSLKEQQPKSRPDKREKQDKPDQPTLILAAGDNISYETERSKVSSAGNQAPLEAPTKPAKARAIKVDADSHEQNGNSQNTTMEQRRDLGLQDESMAPSSIKAREPAKPVKVPQVDQSKAQPETQRAHRANELEQESQAESQQPPEQIPEADQARLGLRLREKQSKPKMITQRAGPINYSMARETDPSSILVKEVKKPAPVQSIQFDVSHTVDAEQPNNDLPLRSDLSSIISPAKQQQIFSSQDDYMNIKEEYSHSETHANIQQLAVLDKERVQKPITPSGDAILLDDWREDVQIGFEPMGGHTAIKLFEAGVMKDRKMLGHDIRQLARSYEAESLEQFCNEWLMPCVTTKENPKTKQLKLLVHGEMLQELITKQQSGGGYASQTNIAVQLDHQSEANTGSQLQEQTARQSRRQDQNFQHVSGSASHSGQTSQQSGRQSGKPNQNADQSKNQESATFEQINQQNIPENSPALQQLKTIRGKEYSISVRLDSNGNILIIKATDPSDQAEHNLLAKLDAPMAEESAEFEMAMIISNLDIEDGTLGIRKAQAATLEQKYLIARLTREMNGSTFVVNVGYREEQLIFVVYDKMRDLTLQLKLKWSMPESPTYEEAMEFVEQLDTKVLTVVDHNGQKMHSHEILILKQ